MIVSIRNALPSCVRSATKSYAQTWFGYAGRNLTQDPLRLLGRHFQSLSPPDPLHPLLVDLPSGLPQKAGHPTISVSPELAGQLHYLHSQRVLIRLDQSHMPLRRSVLPKDPTGAALRYVQPLTHRLYTGPAAGEA